MRIALVLSSSINNSPYVRNYTNILEQRGLAYDIICWNKDGNADVNNFTYSKYSPLQQNPFSKIIDYFGYTKYVVSVLKSNKYDKIIVFTIILGVFLNSYLKKKFSNNYIIDIRDYTFFMKFLKKNVRQLISNSFSTVISSQGFSTWLRDYKKNFFISHNFNFDGKRNEKDEKIFGNEKLTILTIGSLRDYDANINLINAFKNSNNVDLHYVGDGIAYKPLKNYCVENKVLNVIFFGRYQKEDELKYLKSVSLMNIFLEEDLNSRTLLSNRFYLALNNFIPILVNNNSFQGELVEKYKLGVVIKNPKQLDIEVSDYIKNFNEDEFKNGCREFFKDIQKDEAAFREMLMNYLN